MRMNEKKTKFYYCFPLNVSYTKSDNSSFSRTTQKHWSYSHWKVYSCSKKHLVQSKKGSQLHSAIKFSKLTQTLFFFFFNTCLHFSSFLGRSLQCTCRCKCWVTCQSDQEGWSHLHAVYSKWPNIQACRTLMLQDCTKIRRTQATSSHCRTAVLKMNIC